MVIGQASLYTEPHSNMFTSHRKRYGIVITQSESPGVGVVLLPDTLEVPSRDEPVDDYPLREGHVDVVASCSSNAVKLAPQSGQ